MNVLARNVSITIGMASVSLSGCMAPSDSSPENIASMEQAANGDPPSPAVGMNNANRVIFEHRGFERTPPWAGHYFPNLTDAASVKTACDTLTGAGPYTPVVIGGHRLQVQGMFGCDPDAETQSVDADVVACIRRLRPSYVVLAGCNNANEPNLTCSRLLANATGVTVIAASGCVSTQGAHYAAISGEGQWWRIEPAATTGTTSSGAGGGTGGNETTGGASTAATSSGTGGSPGGDENTGGTSTGTTSPGAGGSPGGDGGAGGLPEDDATGAGGFVGKLPAPW